MDQTPRPPAPALDPLRQQVIQQLCEHFAVDNLTAEMLEERLDRVHSAQTPADLQSLVSDLPALRAAQTPAAPGVAPSSGIRRSDYVPDGQVIAAVMGGAARKGPWTVPSKLTIVAVMGGAELDFRQATFGPGVTEINVLAIWGGIELTVPPGVRVETNSLSIMGGVEEKGHEYAAAAYDRDAPVLRIGGLVLMAGVEVKTKPWTDRKPKMDWDDVTDLSRMAMRGLADPHHRKQLKKELRKLTRGWDD